MRTLVAAGITVAVLAACTGGQPQAATDPLTADQVAAMPKATQDQRCAVLTQTPGAETGASAEQHLLVAFDSPAIVSKASSTVVSGKPADGQLPTHTSSAADGWTLTAPCIVFRTATVAGHVPAAAAAAQPAPATGP